MAGIRTCDRESQVQRPNHYATRLTKGRQFRGKNRATPSVAVAAPGDIKLSDATDVPYSDVAVCDLYNLEYYYYY